MPSDRAPDAAARALLVTSVFAAADAADQLGSDAYSYYYVYRALRPLLDRLGEVIEVDRPESRLDYAVHDVQRRGLGALHLSFRPLQYTYLTTLARNIAFPFWEFPDIPGEDIDSNPRHNWLRIAGRLDAILCASEFTRAAFLRAGVRTPVHVIPVPVRDELFAVPLLPPGTSGQLDAPVQLLPREIPRPSEPAPWMALSAPRGLPLIRAHAAVQRVLRATLPMWLDRQVGLLGQAARAQLGALRGQLEASSLRPRLDLSGVVYTSFVNPFDERKNWQDLITAFLLALREHEDATLVVKLVAPAPLRTEGLARVLSYYLGTGIEHRCKLAILPTYLSDSQVVRLTDLSTYYLTATRAEGACLPAQDFLAAGRPVIAPSHTAMTEYITPEVAFIIDSHPEPTWFPQDPARRMRTTWHRVVWQSLHDQIRASYCVACREPERYAGMAQRGREQMRQFAGASGVWSRLQAALSSVSDGSAAVR
jgi:glycosyltransferase involved in cell wall biosynthesis